MKIVRFADVPIGTRFRDENDSATVWMKIGDVDTVLFGWQNKVAISSALSGTVGLLGCTSDNEKVVIEE